MRRIGLLTLLAGIAAAHWLSADTLHVTADAQTSSSQPGVRYGSYPSMTVRGGGGSTLNSYMRFDLSTLPDDPVVQKATLRLWVFGVVTPGTIEVLPVAAPWQEGTISASNSPPLLTPIASFAVESSTALHLWMWTSPAW